MLIASLLSAAEPVPGARLLKVGTGPGEFGTIQSAVDAAGPGDVVEIRAGRYHESVALSRSGEPGRPITLRAAPGAIVVVSPGADLTGRPEPVAGYPNVCRWSAEDAGMPVEKMGIWETASRLRLKRVYALEECDRRLAAWYYDADAQALYIRSSGALPADRTRYVLESADRPAFSVTAGHITIEGLTAAFGAHGFLLGPKSHHVTIRRCRAFCNRSAGIHVTGNDHVIENNEVFRNNTYGIQLRYAITRARVAGNLCYHNGPNNGETTDTSLPTDLGLYGQGDYVVFENNIVDGLHQNAFRTKTGHGINVTTVVRGNVVRGFFDSSGGRCLENNTILSNGLGSRFGFYPMRVNPRYNGDVAQVDPAGDQRRMNLIHPVLDAADPRFADPAWRDFRLQRGSPYEGRGAHPEQAPVFYVDGAGGGDARDGRSADAAVKSFARLLEILRPGATVYLMPAVYTEPLRITLGGLSPDEPLRFRAFGRSADVVLRGGVTVEGVRHVALEGLTLRDAPVGVSKAEGVRMSHCVLAGPGASVEVTEGCDIRLDHLTFSKVAVPLKIVRSSRVALTNSLASDAEACVTCDAESLATFYGDYNTYATPRFAVADTACAGLDAWRRLCGSEMESRAEAVELDEAFALPLDSPSASGADDLTAAGARPPRASDRLDIAGLRAAALGPTTVSLLWNTPRCATESRVVLRTTEGETVQEITPVTTFQIMGEYFDMTFRPESFFATDRHATFSGLTPGCSYDATVIVSDIEGTTTRSATVRFATPRAFAPARTYYVAPAGNDASDGAAPETAWRTFRRAASAAAPGDRVCVMPGVYRETLQPRTSGTAEHPIVFESAEPQAAVIDLMESLADGIAVLNVDHVQVRGFRLINGSFVGGHNVLIANARGIRISQCHVAYPPKATFAKLALGHGGLVATDAPDLVVDNNVFLCGYVGVGMAACPGAQVFNNTLLGEGNYGVVIVPGAPDESYVLRNNLFYRAILGYKTGCQIWMMNVTARLASDHNLFYIPPDHKATLGKLPDTERMATLAEWRKATGLDLGSECAHPVFRDPERGDFRLAEGSPGLTLADDGGPVGIRP